MAEPKIVTVLSTTGGTGTTTQTYHFGLWLGTQGYKVLLIDHDHQCNLTQTFGIFDASNTVAGIYDNEFKEPKPIHDVAENVDLIAGSMHLGTIGETLINKTMKEFILFNWLDENYDRYNISSYDYIILDSHPDLSIIQKNAVMISNHIMSFIEPSQYGGFDAMDSLGTRLEEFKNEARDPRTKDSYVTADIFFVANKIAYNTSTSHEFRETVAQMKDVVAEIPLREVFNRSTIEHKMIFEYEKAPLTDGAKIFFAGVHTAYADMKAAIDKEEK